ncbi:hypothetical protein CVS40_3597 [Lucilia cuprina]|nr:hypothetical protein CVS40_3597 [Lucilia cuprina]
MPEGVLAGGSKFGVGVGEGDVISIKTLVSNTFVLMPPLLRLEVAAEEQEVTEPVISQSAGSKRLFFSVSANEEISLSFSDLSLSESWLWLGGLFVEGEVIMSCLFGESIIVCVENNSFSLGGS